MGVAEPEVWVLSAMVKESLEGVPAEQEYETASCMPTSATCGEHERVAVGAPARGVHCQLAMQVPFIVGARVPVQLLGVGCGALYAHCCWVEGVQGWGT